MGGDTVQTALRLHLWHCSLCNATVHCKNSGEAATQPWPCRGWSLTRWWPVIPPVTSLWTHETSNHSWVEIQPTATTASQIIFLYSREDRVRKTATSATLLHCYITAREGRHRPFILIFGGYHFKSLGKILFSCPGSKLMFWYDMAWFGMVWVFSSMSKKGYYMCVPSAIYHNFYVYPAIPVEVEQKLTIKLEFFNPIRTGIF